MRNLGVEQALAASGMRLHWAYNVFDCCATMGIMEALMPQLSPVTARTYRFEMACLGPALAMMRRGINVDEARLAKSLRELRVQLRRMEKAIDAMPEVRAVWDGTELEKGLCPEAPPTAKGKRHKWPRGVPDSPDRRCERCGVSRIKRAPINPGSWQQVWRLFYDLFGIPKQRNLKGQFSVDKVAMERIRRRAAVTKKWQPAVAICDAIIVLRGVKKQIGFLSSRRAPSGRMHQSVNVGAAWTGRYSASEAPTGDGTNTQNIAEKHRSIFIADPGFLMGYYDLEQADSHTVAYDAGDEAYIAAHKGGNVHVTAARIFFPDLPWTGDDGKDKVFCKQTVLPWDPDHTYYDQSKRNQHGLNFGLTPDGLAAHSHCPRAEAYSAYERYFDWAPRIRARQQEIKAILMEEGALTNPLGRRCQFFGKLDDPHTFKQALSFIPQSMTADVLNLGLHRVWRELEPDRVHLLAQVHDAILFQARPEDEEVWALVEKLMTIPVVMRDGRIMTIPVEAARGKNWGKRSADNPAGMGGF